MDAVIAYVNGCEKVWRTEYIKHCFFIPKKYTWFYDWGTLKYVLRGISRYMPFIKNVFLIVSNIEQVPEYVDQSKVKVVLHKDFIPEQFLPTFQANTIEMCMHMIPGLDEEFIYFNDDMIPMSQIKYGDLMCGGKPCLSFVENYSDPGAPSYYFIKNSFRAACDYVYLKKTYDKNVIEDPVLYMGPGYSHIHCPCVFLKSKNDDIYNTLNDKYDISYHITTERQSKNLNQYLYSDVFYLENNYIKSNLTLTYFRTDYIDEETCNDMISSINTNYLCINDFGPINGFTTKESSDILQKALNKKFSKKCKYEYDSNK